MPVFEQNLPAGIRRVLSRTQQNLPAMLGRCPLRDQAPRRGESPDGEGTRTSVGCVITGDRIDPDIPELRSADVVAWGDVHGALFTATRCASACAARDAKTQRTARILYS